MRLRTGPAGLCLARGQRVPGFLRRLPEVSLHQRDFFRRPRQVRRPDNAGRARRRNSRLHYGLPGTRGSGHPRRAADPRLALTEMPISSQAGNMDVRDSRQRRARSTSAPSSIRKLAPAWLVLVLAIGGAARAQETVTEAQEAVRRATTPSER